MNAINKIETDPNGLSAHSPGAKLDAGKPMVSMVLGGFARALMEVSKVGTFGAKKYTPNGWMTVPDGIQRYADAKVRHQLYEAMGETHDSCSELLHAAHEAWNALAKLELMLREEVAAVASVVVPMVQTPAPPVELEASQYMTLQDLGKAWDVVTPDGWSSLSNVR